MNNNSQFREMIHANNNDYGVGFLCGMVGGLWKYFAHSKLFLTGDWIAVTARLLEAGGTAFICGILGVAGKEVFKIGYAAFKKRFKK